MTINPYQSPTETNEPVAEVLPDRAVALRRIHRAMLILAIPGALNFLCWHLLLAQSIMAAYPRGVYIETTFFSLLLLLAAWMFLWKASLRLMEYAAVVVQFVFGRRISHEEWLSAMYRSLWTLGWAAPAGAVVWLIWLLLIYGLRVNFMVASVPLGIIGHLLGACVYLNIFYSWYRVRRR